MKYLPPLLLAVFFSIPAHSAELDDKQKAFAEVIGSLRKDVDAFFEKMKACQIPVFGAEAEVKFKPAIAGLELHEQEVLKTADLVKSTQAGAQCTKGITDAKIQLKAAKDLFDKETKGTVDRSPEAAKLEERLRNGLRVRTGEYASLAGAVVGAVSKWVTSSTEEQKAACRSADAAITPMKNKKEAMEKAFNELTASVDGVACRTQASSAELSSSPSEFSGAGSSAQ